jgi:hypothetical protein
MLCRACAYEFVDAWNAEKRCFLPTIGNKKFIVVKGSFHVEREGNWASYIDNVTVYACPECGTLKLNENL